ncbi:MAG: protein kinase [Erysipelotrichales bacterium]
MLKGLSTINIKDVNGIKVVEKEVENVEVYHQLFLHNFDIAPRIISIDDFNCIINYEYIEGNSLYELLNEDKLSLMQRMDVAVELVNALALINKNNIIHKDIKPENIIYSNDFKLYLIDFGASRLFDGNKSRDTVLLGTQDYASPEHYGYQETTYKSDMYSLGYVLKDLKLTSPFDNIIERCTQINPNDRYNSYLDIINDCNKAIILVSQQLAEAREKEIKELVKKENKRLQDRNSLNNKFERNKKSVDKNNEDLDVIFEKEKKKDLKYMFINYRYNFDNSLIQWILTLLIILPIMLMKDAVNSTISPGVSFIAKIYVAFCLCYVVDMIRMGIKRIWKKEIKYLRYLFISILNLSIGLILYVLLGVLIEVINEIML